jgi:hypothetical protein
MSTAERSTAADPVLDLFGPSHIGIVVDDLQSAMAELGAAWRTSWSPGRDGTVGIPFRGAAGIKTVYLKTAWGERGPVRVELIEAVADTIWPPGSGAYFHHLGYSVADLESETARMGKLRLELEWTRAEGPSPQVNGFGYFRFPSGLLIELVSSAID